MRPKYSQADLLIQEYPARLPWNWNCFLQNSEGIRSSVLLIFEPPYCTLKVLAVSCWYLFLIIIVLIQSVGFMKFSPVFIHTHFLLISDNLMLIFFSHYCWLTLLWNSSICLCMADIYLRLVFMFVYYILVTVSLCQVWLL